MYKKCMARLLIDTHHELNGVFSSAVQLWDPLMGRPKEV